MTDRRRYAALRFSVGLPLRSPALGPRLLTQALDVVSRRVGFSRAAGTMAVCASASGCRSQPDRRSGSGGGASARPRHRSPFPGFTDPHERAQEVIESHTTSPSDLASLLEMLGLKVAAERP